MPACLVYMMSSGMAHFALKCNITNYACLLGIQVDGVEVKGPSMAHLVDLLLGEEGSTVSSYSVQDVIFCIYRYSRVTACLVIVFVLCMHLLFCFCVSIYSFLCMYLCYVFVWTSFEFFCQTREVSCILH